MTGGATEVREVSLGEGFGDVAVNVNGDGSVDVYGNAAVASHLGVDRDTAANDGAVTSGRAPPRVGDKMPAGHPKAGWVYAGISETTKEPFYAASKDSGVFKWKESMAFAAKENARLPSAEELNQLYNAKNEGALKGTFDETGSIPAGWYWSSTEDYVLADSAWVQRFVVGYCGWYLKSYESSLRLVRS